MTVMLVLVTFLIFATVDYYLNRGKSPRRLVDKTHTAVPKIAAEPITVAAFEPGVDWVDGFAIPERMRYHAGHAWCVRAEERPPYRRRRFSGEARGRDRRRGTAAGRQVAAPGTEGMVVPARRREGGNGVAGGRRDPANQ